MSDSTTPLLFLASRLTGLDQGLVPRVEGELRTIETTARQSTRDASECWSIETHVPFRATAPWSNHDSDTIIWRGNVDRIASTVDGLIIHGVGGGSFGVGSEATIAHGHSLPILYLHPKGERVSKFVSGMAKHSYAMSVVEFGDSDDLEWAVSEWLDTNRHLIENGPRRRERIAAIWARLHLELRSAWATVSMTGNSPAIVEVCFVAGMGVHEIEHVMMHPLFLHGLPAGKLVRLAGSLGVPISDLLGSLTKAPALDAGEEAALQEWQRQEGFGDDFTDLVRRRALTCRAALQQRDRQVRLSGAPARAKSPLDLSTGVGWRQFYLSWRDGDLD